MTQNRRQFLRRSFIVSTTLPFIPEIALGNEGISFNKNIPKRLKAGDTVGLVSPAGITYDSSTIQIVKETLEVLGLKVKEGKYLLERWGYLAGSDEARATDLNEMFADKDVDAILPLTGGWGCARLLPFIDFEVVKRNPKIFMGFSDITALLISLYAKGDLVTFHGPNARSEWNEFTVNYVRRILFEGDRVVFENPKSLGDELVSTSDRAITITPGVAQGKLIGGNLTVLTAIIGSDFLPDFSGHILFLEDINEGVYRIDRMLTQLKLAGILDTVNGIVFGKCTECEPDSGYSSFTLEEVLRNHFEPLGIPTFMGSMIGHIRNKFTLPIGISCEINATRGSIKLLEPAVL